MNMLPIEIIFVNLQHGSKDRRDIGLPAIASRQRLAGRVFRKERGQREHIRQSSLFDAGGDSSREEIPDIRFPSRAHMVTSGLVAVPDIHHGSHSEVSRRWEDPESGCSLGGCRGALDIHEIMGKCLVILWPQVILAAILMTCHATAIGHIVRTGIAEGFEDCVRTFLLDFQQNLTLGGITLPMISVTDRILESLHLSPQTFTTPHVVRLAMTV